MHVYYKSIWYFQLLLLSQLNFCSKILQYVRITTCAEHNALSNDIILTTHISMYTVAT